MSYTSADILITTFNRPETLELVLQSLQFQTVAPRSVIIADDGSNESTQHLIREWQEKLHVIHCWIPDNGFRAARSRNIALKKVSTDYVIMIDGDCVVPPTFVEAHLALAADNKIIAGGRHLLDQQKTSSILKSELSSSSEIFRPIKFLRLRLGILRDMSPNHWNSVRTCNLSAPLKLIKAINGFDESYVGWGREDTDFVIRLTRTNARIRSGRFAAAVCHLWHPEAPRTQLSLNDDKLNRLLSNDSLLPTKSCL